MTRKITMFLALMGLVYQLSAQTEEVPARYEKERPILEVALNEYGNDSLNVMGGYIRQVVPFTTDLASLSQRLFELDTNGGSEYCGKVMLSAARQLDWDDNRDSLKLLFIAGNEPFDQGPVDFRRASRALRSMDVTVNTIFCGDYQEGIRSYWEEGASLTGGSYLNINADYKEAYVMTPYDDRLSQLNRRLNDTYIGFGAAEEMKKQVQETQDSNARGLGFVAFLDRAAVKSSESYSNAEWDLVDALEEGEVGLDAMPTEALPAPMRAMDTEEREEYVQDMSVERRAIQEEINALNRQREAYLLEQKAAEPEEEESTLGSAMEEAIQKAARTRGFETEN